MSLLTPIRDVMDAGGWVMYPLTALSVVALAVAMERGVYWIGTNSPGRRRALAKTLSSIRERDFAKARTRARKDRSVYGRFALGLLDASEGRTSAAEIEAVAIELAEMERPGIERFSTLLSTIVTAAPMLGILGTVTGIIASFQILGGQEAVTDPTAVAGGIAEALITTAYGLIVALVSLFPYAVFRAQTERCLGRLELIASTVALSKAGLPADGPSGVSSRPAEAP